VLGAGVDALFELSLLELSPLELSPLELSDDEEPALESLPDSLEDELPASFPPEELSPSFL
jgi:hypothetical protein